MKVTKHWFGREHGARCNARPSHVALPIAQMESESGGKLVRVVNVRGVRSREPTHIALHQAIGRIEVISG